MVRLLRGSSVYRMCRYDEPYWKAGSGNGPPGGHIQGHIQGHVQNGTSGCGQSSQRSANIHDEMIKFPALVLGWIEADFCNQGLILQHFSRSTRKSSSREQILQKFGKFCKNFRNFQNLEGFGNILAKFAKILPNLLARK